MFVVGREQIRQYALAVKANDPATHEEAAARNWPRFPRRRPTFASILALMIQQDFFRNVDIGMETMQIVQVDQRFIYHKPIKVGDRLT